MRDHFNHVKKQKEYALMRKHTAMQQSLEIKIQHETEILQDEVERLKRVNKELAYEKDCAFRNGCDFAEGKLNAMIDAQKETYEMQLE